MKNLFAEKRLVFATKKDASEMLPGSAESAKKSKETSEQKKARLKAERENARKGIVDKTKESKSGLRQNMTLELLMKDVDSVKKLREKMRTTSIGMIEKVEDKYPGITLAAFTKHLKGSKKLNLKNWSSDKLYGLFKPGIRFKVDFLGNNDAEQKWGASDMLSITMRSITKYEGGNDKFKRTSIRRVGLKGQNKDKRGFYDNQGYIAIHTGDEFSFSLTNPEYKDLYRKKSDGSYKEIDEESYRKYAKSKDAEEDKKFHEKNMKNRSFITKRPSVSREKIIEIRDKIGGLEGLPPQERIVKVAMFLTKPENNMYARHCGDWVDRVYAIAGITRKKTLYMDISYAFVNRDRKQGWKPLSDISGRDCRIEGVFASDKLLNGLQEGDWVWVNNRNKYRSGNHSVIFLGWVNKDKKIARVASWFGNARGKQKISTYNFKNMPVTAIRRATHASDILPSQEPKFDLANADQKELIKRGSTPYPAKVGYRLSPEEHKWYRSVRKEAHKMARYHIQRRMDVLQERYKMMDALRHSAAMVGLRDKDWKFFLAMNDAVQYVESGYNTFCSNQKKAGNTSQVHLSSAAGEYQILAGVWRGMKKYQRNDRKGRALRRQMKRYGIDPELLMQVDLSASRPEYATPFQRAVVHNFFMFRYSRMMRKLESIDSIFDKIRSYSGHERESWGRAIYLYWRNGPNGAAPFIRNLRNGIMLPRTEAEMRYYYDNYLKKSDWQYKRGYRDFRSVMRTTQKFYKRFQKNLFELG